MKTYTVKPDGFNAVRRRMLITGISTFSISFLGAALLLSAGGLTPLGFGLLFIIVFVAGGIAIRRSIQHQRETWSSYTLTLEDDYILKQQSHHADIRINLDEITAIQKAYTGDIVVKTKSWKKYILIPKGLNGFDEVESYLAGLKPIKKQPVALMLSVFATVAVISLSAVGAIGVYLQGYTPSLLTIFLVVIILLIMSLILLVVLRRMPGVDERARPKRWHLIFMIGYILLLVISFLAFFALGTR